MHSNDKEGIERKEPEDRGFMYMPGFENSKRLNELLTGCTIDEEVTPEINTATVDKVVSDNEGKKVLFNICIKLENEVEWHNQSYKSRLRAGLEMMFGKRGFLGFEILQAGMENPVGRKYPIVNACCRISLRY